MLGTLAVDRQPTAVIRNCAVKRLAGFSRHPPDSSPPRRSARRVTRVPKRMSRFRSKRSATWLR